MADKSIYDYKKEEVMSQNELAMGQDLLMYYRSAWEDKDDRKLFQLWNLIEVYWEGEANQQFFVGDPASNINIVHPNIETIVSLVVDKNMSVETYANTPAEKQYLTQITNMMEFIKDKNRTVYKTYDFTRRLAKFGTGIYRADYDPDAVNGFGLPMLYNVNPAYLFIDPNIVDMDDIQDGLFVIESDLRSIESARREFGSDLADAIAPGYDPTYNATIYGEEPGGGREYGRQYYIHLLVWLKEWVKDDKPVDEEDLMDISEEDLDEYTLKLRLVEMSADGVILRDTFEEEDPPYFPGEEFPYFVGTNYKREGCAWGKGDAELMMDPQEQLNDYDDQIRQYMRLVGNPQRWIDPSSGCDPRKWTNEPGLTVPIIGGTSNAGYFHPAPMQPQLPDRRDRIMDTDVPTLTRINAQMMGRRQKGVDSATEALALRESSNSVLDEKSETVRETLNRAFEYLFKLAIHYWDEEKIFRITGKKGFTTFNPNEMTRIPAMDVPDDDFLEEFSAQNPGATPPEFAVVTDTEDNVITKEAEISINIKIGTGTSQNKSFTYSVIKEAWREQALKKSTFLQYLKDELDIPIPEEDINEAKNVEQVQYNALMQAVQQPGPQGGQQQATGSTNQQQKTMTGVPEGANASMGADFTPSGSPRRPQSTMKAEVDSIAKN